MSRKTWLRAVSQGSVLLALTSCYQSWLANLTTDNSPPPYGMLRLTSVPQMNAALSTSAGSGSVVSAATGTSTITPSSTTPVNNGVVSTTVSTPAMNSTGVMSSPGLSSFPSVGSGSGRSLYGP